MPKEVKYGYLSGPRLIVKAWPIAASQVIVDRGVNGGEFPESLDVPELRHRALSSSERLM